MKPAEPDTQKPGEFEAGGSSPPGPGIPPQLAEELAEIIAEALVADCCTKVSKINTTSNSAAPATVPAQTKVTEETTQCLRPTR